MESVGGKIKRGREGEQIALEYLLQRGFKLMERNWRHRHLEVDLIMEKGGMVHIVEVRSKSFPAIVDPLESVGRAKRNNLIKAANYYVLDRRIDSEVVFDIVSVLFLPNGDYNVEFYENAFLPFRGVL